MGKKGLVESVRMSPQQSRRQPAPLVAGVAEGVLLVEVHQQGGAREGVEVDVDQRLLVLAKDGMYGLQPSPQ